MNRGQIEAAIERNLPFTLRMADGKEYHVPHRDYISLPPVGAFVVVYDDRQHVFVLPLITMTELGTASHRRPPTARTVSPARCSAAPNRTTPTRRWSSHCAGE